MSQTCNVGGEIPIQHKNSKKNEDENGCFCCMLLVGGMGIAYAYSKEIFLLVSVP